MCFHISALGMGDWNMTPNGKERIVTWSRDKEEDADGEAGE